MWNRDMFSLYPSYELIKKVKGGVVGGYSRAVLV